METYYATDLYYNDMRPVEPSRGQPWGRHEVVFADDAQREMERMRQGLERIIARAQLNTSGRTKKIVEIAKDALRDTEQMS